MMKDRVTLDILPGTLAEIARETSVPVALAIARRFGGTDLYVPLNPTEHDPLARCVGIDAANRIARLYGGGRVEIPLGNTARRAERNRAIRRMAAEGRSVSEIARRFGMTTRSIRRIKNARRDKHGRRAPPRLR